MQINSQIWEKLINFSSENPLQVAALEKKFQIQKLQLSTYTPTQIRLRIIELTHKHQSNGQVINKNWLQNQYKLFVWFIFTYSNYTKQQPQQLPQSFWDQTSQLFHKDCMLCKYFFFCSIKSKTQTWLEQEDKLIETAMKIQGLQKKWTQIGLYIFAKSDGLYIRKAKAIRQRWLSHLNPCIKKSQWTNEEDVKLLALVLNYGKKWSKISRIFGNRSEHTIKNRYNKIIIRNLKKKQINSIEEYQIQTVHQHISYLKTKMNRNIKKKSICTSSNSQAQENSVQKQFMFKQEQLSENSKENIKTEHKMQQNKLQNQGIIFQPIILTYNGFYLQKI